jgi:1,4-alpha-glucan branching enzyme
MTQDQKPKRRRVNFSLVAPSAESVYLAGDFNAWDPWKHPMKKSENSVWQKTVMLFPGRYEYRFLVDGRWTNDLQNPETCPNCYGTLNNVIQVSAHKS